MMKSASISCGFIVVNRKTAIKVSFSIGIRSGFVNRLMHDLSLINSGPPSASSSLSLRFHNCVVVPFFSVPNVDLRISADGTRYCACRKHSTRYWVKERKINEVIDLFSNGVSEKI